MTVFDDINLNGVFDAGEELVNVDVVPIIGSSVLNSDSTATNSAGI